MSHLKTLLAKWLGSFDNYNPASFSARKLTAFAMMVLVFWLHNKVVSKATAWELVQLIALDLLAIFMLLGIITAEHLIKLKKGDTPPTPPSE